MKQLKPMKVMVIGSGAREHALAWKLKQSPLAEEVICCPGNAGMARDFKCVAPAEKGPQGYLSTALAEGVDFTVVGPEAPLVEGVVDWFGECNLDIFGPSKRAAMITEGSKVACKNLLRRAGVPTADSYTTRSFNEAEDYVRGCFQPLVVKADGLAAGKGVLVTNNQQEALEAVDRIMVKEEFGEAGNAVVIEDRLYGRECSFIVVTDGTYAVPMIQAQDYKRQSDGDTGLMTGGMGSFAPAPLSDDLVECVLDKIVYPTLTTLRNLYGLTYKGAMYFGLMLAEDGPKVLEINCRFGDPETQVILPLMKSDLLELMVRSTWTDGLQAYEAEWSSQHAVGVVLAVPGYPNNPQTGSMVTGVWEARLMGAHVFCAGLKPALKDFLQTAGGRVVTVVHTGVDRQTARENAYCAAYQVKFLDKQYRTDIGA